MEPGFTVQTGANFNASITTAPPPAAVEQAYFYTTDPAGTVLSVSDASANEVWRASYQPFGNTLSVTMSVPNTKQFIGKETDMDTNMQNVGVRYLKNDLGRFISPDKVGAVDLESGEINFEILANPQRLNVYAYGLNNPYRFIDRDGYWTASVGSTVSGSLFGLGGGGGTFINIGHNPNSSFLSGWSFSITGTAGAGAVAGLGAGVGITFSGTNSSDVSQLLGTFVEGGKGGLGRGGVGYFQSPDGSVQGGALTLTLEGGSKGYTSTSFGESTTSAIVQAVQGKELAFGVDPSGSAIYSIAVIKRHIK